MSGTRWDVVVVGAGAAGLGAVRTALEVALAGIRAPRQGPHTGPRLDRYRTVSFTPVTCRQLAAQRRRQLLHRLCRCIRGAPVRARSGDGHFGGRWTLEVEAAALEAMIDFAEQALPPAFGADVRRRLRAAATTARCGDPRMAGYSCALPGQAPLCARFAEPHGERVLFAGEPRSCEH